MTQKKQFVIDTSAGLESGIRKLSKEKQRRLLKEGMQHRDAEIVEALLNVGTGLDFRYLEGFTPLSAAVMVQNVEWTRRFLKHGADPSLRNKSGSSPLSLAAERGNEEIVKILLAHGADIDNFWNPEQNPMIKAAYFGYPEVVKILIESGAQMRLPFQDGQTVSPIVVAAQNGHTEVLAVLLEYEDYLRTSPNEFSEAFSYACINGQIVTMEFMLARGIDLNYSHTKKHTALMLAVFSGKEEAVRLLLEAGAAINVQTQLGCALSVALQFQHMNIAKLLLSKGADVSLPGLGGNSAVGVAAYFNDLGMVKSLLDRGADPNKGLGMKSPALTWAVLHQNHEMAELLIRAGADFEVECPDGGGPLLYAIEDHDARMVSILLNAGADPNHRNNYGDSPLMLATDMCNVEVMELLLKSGADISATNKRGYNCLDVARARGVADIERLLLEKGIIDSGEMQKEAERRVRLAQKKVFEAAKNGDFQLIDSVFEDLDDIDIRNEAQITPFMVAAAAGHFDLADLFVEMGANINAVDGKGQSALTRARSVGRAEVIDYLTDLGCNEIRSEPAQRKRKKTQAKKDLITAILDNDVSLVRNLLEKRRKPDQLDAAGRKPALFIAVERGSVELVDLLLQYEANPNAIDRANKFSALMIASRQGLGRIANKLLSCGADPNHAGHGGVTALMLAIQKKYVAIISLLLSSGADPNLRSVRGKTAWDFAKANRKITGILEGFQAMKSQMPRWDLNEAYNIFFQDYEKPGLGH